ncbi:MAG: glucose-6-phosphate isomerase family protein [Methanoregula sp.]|nr:glucose-6-phosphate isomerase family protein [Methanoregula sp.]
MPVHSSRNGTWQKLKADRTWLHSHAIRYDISTISPVNPGGEYVKIKGHYHPENPAGTVFPELFEVIEGIAHLVVPHDLTDKLFQKISIKFVAQLHLPLQKAHILKVFPLPVVSCVTTEISGNPACPDEFAWIIGYGGKTGISSRIFLFFSDGIFEFLHYLHSSRF